MKLTSQALPSSETFRANRAAHLAALETIRQAAEQAAAGGGEASRERHVSRGKMLRASGWRTCSTPDRRFWRSAQRRHTVYTMGPPLVLA